MSKNKNDNFHFKRLGHSGAHSKHVLIPAGFLKKLGIDDDSLLIVKLDESNEQILIRKISEDELLGKNG